MSSPRGALQEWDGIYDPINEAVEELAERYPNLAPAVIGEVLIAQIEARDALTGFSSLMPESYLADLLEEDTSLQEVLSAMNGRGRQRPVAPHGMGGAGDAMLFYDPENSGEITGERQYARFKPKYKH